jgi:hypothetical protein
VVGPDTAAITPGLTLQRHLCWPLSESARQYYSHGFTLSCCLRQLSSRRFSIGVTVSDGLR